MFWWAQALAGLGGGGLHKGQRFWPVALATLFCGPSTSMTHPLGLHPPGLAADGGGGLAEGDGDGLHEGHIEVPEQGYRGRQLQLQLCAASSWIPQRIQLPQRMWWLTWHTCRTGSERCCPLCRLHMWHWL